MVFAMFFRFHLLTFVFVLFLGGEDGRWLCFGSVILSENHKYGFRIEDMSSLVMKLFCWMHISIQHDWFYHDVDRKG